MKMRPIYIVLVPILGALMFFLLSGCTKKDDVRPRQTVADYSTTLSPIYLNVAAHCFEGVRYFLDNHGNIRQPVLDKETLQPARCEPK